MQTKKQIDKKGEHWEKKENERKLTSKARRDFSRGDFFFFFCGSLTAKAAHQNIKQTTSSSRCPPQEQQRQQTPRKRKRGRQKLFATSAQRCSPT
jgi:hypothetical protein